MNTESDHLIGWLAARDVACPVCRYNLRDLKVPTCPECSARLELAVASPSLNMGPWFFAAISMGMGIGFDSVVSVLMTVGLLVSPPPTPAQRIHVGIMLATFVLAAGVGATCLIVSYRTRRRWAYRQRQWTRAWVIFAITFFGHALMALFLIRLLS